MGLFRNSTPATLHITGGTPPITYSVATSNAAAVPLSNVFVTPTGTAATYTLVVLVRAPLLQPAPSLVHC
jgi:hypothetical protein